MVTVVLETVLGLSFVFLLLALMVTACVDGIAVTVSKRAKFLLRGLEQMFGDEPVESAGASDASRFRTASANAEKKLADTAVAMAAPNAAAKTIDSGWTSIISHPLLASLVRRPTSGDRRLPNYGLPTRIPPQLFAQALIDRLATGRTDAQSKPLDVVDDVLAAIATKDVSQHLAEAIRALVKTLPRKDAAALEKAISAWYTDQMDAVSEGYRRWSKRWAMVIGLGVAVGLNVSSVAVAHALYVNQPAREATVAAATNGQLCVDQIKSADKKKCLDAELKALEDAELPIGWASFGDRNPTTLGGWLVLLAGWAITGLAASFGAPFWSDALKRLTGVRQLVVKGGGAS